MIFPVTYNENVPIFLKFMFDDDKSWLLHEFFSVNDKHDEYRKEKFEEIFPEYKNLRTYCYDKWTKQ